ncbi:MAG: tetratricopeptide repeat protein [Planctomycetaceae bacterium]|nr:tetratricopeptide repeat protein [Planctomycetaceae bacterium]
MTRTRTTAIVAAAMMAAYLLSTSSLSFAEPITSGDPTRAAAAKTSDQPREVTEAAALFKQNNAEGALKLLKEAVKKDPDLPPAHVIMAEWFAQMNSPVGMRAALERAVVDTPNDPEPYVLIGNVAMTERRVTEARLCYDKAESLVPEWKGSAKRREIVLPQLQNGLASTCEARNDWAGAKKHLEAWLKLDPKSVTALNRWAHCLFEEKDPRGALDKLREALKIDPDSLTPEAVLGQWYARAGDQDNARKWIVAALAAAPQNVKTQLVAAQWYFEMGQLDQAKEYADAAYRLDPKNLDAMNFRGLIALFQKDYRKAEAYFEAAMEKAPDQMKFAASNNLALALAEQSDESKKAYAMDLASKNFSKYPRMADAVSTLGWVLYRRGQLDDAEKVLRNLATSGSVNADSAYYLACVLKDRGQNDAARLWLESALKSPAPFQHRDEAKALLAKLPPATKKADSGKTSAAPSK